MQKGKPLEIHCDSMGLAVSMPEAQPHVELKWDDVNGILAYKRDVFAFDLICLGFVTANETVEGHEQMQGWSQLVEQLPSWLPGVPPLSEWWERVAQPPFGTSRTTLFDRAQPRT